MTWGRLMAHDLGQADVTNTRETVEITAKCPTDELPLKWLICCKDVRWAFEMNTFCDWLHCGLVGSSVFPSLSVSVCVCDVTCVCPSSSFGEPQPPPKIKPALGLAATPTLGRMNMSILNSWDSPAFNNDVVQRRQYRIGLNLFNK